MTGSAYDAVVIGAGVIGCSVAYGLALDGRRVCVVERSNAPGTGSTSASSAVVRFNYSTRAGVAVAWESMHAWEKWPQHLGGGGDDAGLATFVKTGALAVESPDQDSSAVLALFDEVGVDYEVWDAATIRRRLPLVDPSRFYPPTSPDDPAFWAEARGELNGYWTPDGGFVDDPQLAAHNLMAAAMRRGAQFRFRASVQAIRRAGDHVAGVELADGSVVTAPVVINVAGPHSGAINALAGVDADFAVHTRPLRQEVHEVRAPAAFHDGGVGPVILDLDQRGYYRGTPSGGLLVGGAEAECDPLVWLNDPDDYDIRASKSAYDAQVYRAAKRIPDLAVPHQPRGIAGVYDVSDDWIPIYDKTALGGYYVAIGTSGNQFKNAPVVGAVLAAIVRASDDGVDHDREPVQLCLPRTGLEVDLSHYSRRRAINRDSTFSVMG